LASTPPSSHHPLLGAYVGAAAPGNEQALHTMEQSLGHKLDYAVTFLNHNSWSDFDSSASWALSQWPSNEKLLISVPLIPNGADLGTAATGAYNQHYLHAAQQIAAHDPNAIIRVGWEMNGDHWFPWAAADNPSGYIGAYRQLVDTFRSVSPNFKFDWTPNIGTQAIDPAKVYPGDAYVDTIGLDINEGAAWVGNKTPAERWDWLLHQPNGLQWQHDFAAAHGKAMSYPEYASDIDDGTFVAHMADWIKHNNVAFHSWWDSDANFNGDLQSHPANEHAFDAAWGAQSDWWHGG
jgi:hypothetical protein